MRFIDVLRNKFTLKAYAETGPRTLAEDPLQSFQYSVKLSADGSELSFTKVSGLSREVEVIEYFENGFPHAHKLPGRESVGEITFEKGMYADSSFVDEFEAIVEEDSSGNNQCRHDVIITINDRWGSPKRTFTLHEAWFSKYEVGDLDSSSSDVIVETLTVVYEYMSCGTVTA